jgi:predicted transposase YbfD/YdcC
MAADFPFARTLIVLHNDRTVKKTATPTLEPHYYLSSASASQYTPCQWIELIRGHWGGVEIRNHWRRDAIMKEDGSRSRNPNLLANLALLRSAMLTVFADHFPDQSLPHIREYLHSRPGRCMALLSS